MAPKARPTGECGLCGRNRTLAVSHALPAGLYRLCRPVGEANANPYIVTNQGMVQASDQITDYFLCDECEKKFNERGEDWVLKQCYRGNKFWLRESLTAVAPFMSTDDTSVYLAANIERVNVAALTYFAMSVFWRAGARSWVIRGVPMAAIRLKVYQERLRLFLDDQAPFPENVALSVWVSRNTAPHFATYFPTSERQEDCITHRLYIPGIQFILSIGQQMDEGFIRGSIATGGGNPIYLSTGAETVPLQKAREWIHRHREAAQR